MYESRLRSFGGTSGHWGGQTSTLDKMDFQKRSWIKNSGWPIQFSELTRFYSKANKILNLKDVNYDPDYWVDNKKYYLWKFKNNDINTKMFHLDSPPTHFGEKYRETLKKSDNIHIYLYANLTDIDIDDDFRRINYVKIATFAKKIFKVKAKVFVLACGGIENARLLLNSNKKISAGIGNQNDLVGRFFMEHPHLYTAGSIFVQGNSANSNLYHYWAAKGNAKISGFLQLSEKLQKKNQLTNLTFIIRKNDIFSQLDDLGKNLFNISQKLNNIQSNKYRISPFTTMSEQVPNPDSRITLSEDVDNFGQRRINLNWQIMEIDKTSIEKSLSILAINLSVSRLGRLRTFIRDLKTLTGDKRVGWYRARHHMGTTRMSDNPKEGVTDKNCKVHGISNLYIAGSSVFPTCGCANPTLTIVALAVRLGEHLDSVFKHKEL